VNLTLLLFIPFAVLLVGLLVWTGRPPRRKLVSTKEVLEALSGERHSSHLPQILQALQPTDVEFLQERGRGELLKRLRTDRKRIALHYLNRLLEDFEILLEASRLLAVMSPEVIAMQEFERFKLSLRFRFCCRYLRWRLQLGLTPWRAFGFLSGMAGHLALQLESATKQIGERAALAGEFTSALEQRRRDPL
jgi:hypothetical protein